MAKLSDETYEEFKKISDEKGITYESELEMKHQADNLVELVRILIDAEQEELKRKRRLETEPMGYSMPGDGRGCSLCQQMVYGADGWYDKWGFKCMNCQDAVNKKKIPGSLCGDYDHKKYVTDSTLAYKSGLHVQTIRKLIRRRDIKARQIPKGPFLILQKDNPNLAGTIEAEIKAKEASSTR